MATSRVRLHVSVLVVATLLVWVQEGVNCECDMVGFSHIVKTRMLKVAKRDNNKESPVS